jgi:hypothetical protein
MYRPPAVRYEVAWSRWHLAATAVLGFAAVVATAYFVLQTSSWVIQFTVLGTLASAISCTIWGWLRTPHGTLRWDGTLWHWSAWGDVPVAQLQVLMDLQFALALRLRSEAGQHCLLWLEHRSSDANWRAMRRALVAHQRHPAPQASATAAMDERALP